jgi:sugar lactone lactonase YvrE
VTHDGRVFLRLNDAVMDRGGYLEFSSSGERVARHKWEDRSRAWDPATGGFWAVHDNEVASVTENGQLLTTVARRADRKWLGWIAGLVVAPDGSLAVAASRNLMREQEGWSLNLYAPNGDPVRLIWQSSGEAPAPFAYDGRAVALWDAGYVRILDTSGQPVARFKPRPGGREAVDWPLFLTAQRGELWMFDASAKTMHRYEMP